MWKAVLKRRLESIPDAVVEQACAENPWFAPAEIRYAAEALLPFFELSSRPVENPRNVGLILAGNIPLVGFADVFFTLLMGHHAFVKPSHKDDALIRYLFEGFVHFEMPAHVDAVIATGSDRTAAIFREKYIDKPLLVRGSRHSAAILQGDETPEELAKLSDDLFLYSGLGCRSVSLLLVPQGYIPRLPPREMNPLHRQNYLQRRALRAVTGEKVIDIGHALLVPGTEFPEALSEITLVRTHDPDEWIKNHAYQIQCVIARPSFGRTQRPRPTDWADGINTLEFLSNL